MTARTITTAAELDALPVGSVVRTARGAVATRHERARGTVLGWLVAGYFGPQVLYADTDLPAVILHDPSAPAVPVVSDAAVEAAARALADDWNPDRDPVLTAMFRDYAATAVAAALPFLGAAPSATSDEGGLAAPPKPWEHADHRPVQHRDGRAPWCEACGWTSPAPARPAVLIAPRADR